MSNSLRPRPWRRCLLRFPGLAGVILPSLGLAAPLGIGNLVVTHYHPEGPYFVYEYTPAGSLVQQLEVPVPGDVFPRDLCVDAGGRVHLFNGTFAPWLSTLEPATTTWTHHTTADWGIANNVFSGGLGFWNDFVFVADSLPTGGWTAGILRFDLADDYSARRLAQTGEFVQVTVGRDGLLYALGPGGSPSRYRLEVYDPYSTLHLRTISLPVSIGGFDVDASGHIFATGWTTDSRLFELDENGVILKQLNTYITYMGDINLAADGRLVVGAGRNILVTDVSLSSFQSFQAVGPWDIATFASWVEPARGAMPACRAVPAGIVGWWPGDGSAKDLVTGRVGTFQGGMLANAAGRVGAAFRCDGTNDYLALADAPELRPARLTLEAWVYPTALGGWRTVAFKGAGGGLGYALYADNDGSHPAGHVVIGGTEYAAFASQPLGLNAWTHLAMTYDGSALRLYVNGELAAAGSLSGTLAASPEPFCIGGNPIWGEHFQGRIDEVALYNRALGPEEIAAIHAAGPAGKCKAPALTSPPASLTVPYGSNAVFEVVAGGVGPLSYQWRKGGTALADGGRISGATSAVLTIQDVQAGDAGEYSVTAANEYRSVSSAPATLNVLMPPRITLQPTNQTVDFGQGFVLTAAAEGAAPLFHQWTKGGVALSTNGRIAGAETPTLSVSNAAGSDSGDYRLIVSNAIGSATSLVATVVVKDPIITSQPASATFAPGQTAGFAVAAAGTPPLHYQWFKDGAPLAQATEAGLTLANVQLADAGAYFAVISNGYGCVTSAPAVLSINAVTVDAGFAPSPNGPVFRLALQGDDKLIVAGSFNNVAGVARSYVARLHPHGTLDPAFNPQPNGAVSGVAVEAGGGILLAGQFYTVMNQSRGRMARIFPDGTLDPNFNPGADDAVDCLVLQVGGSMVVAGAFDWMGGGHSPLGLGVAQLAPWGLYYNWPYNRPRWGVLTMAMQTDGSLLLGGHFSVVDDFSVREHIARISPNGFLDGGFNPGANGSVYALAVQADGRILLGGTFTVAGGQPRTNLARLHPDGRVDAAFQPPANGGVYALALQTDRKILIGGDFTEVSGVPRSRLARLNADGTLDPTFDPGANGPVQALTIQPDGAMLVGGSFTLLGGQPVTNLGRLFPVAAASQSLAYDGSNVTWLRGGSGPEVWHTLFSHSTNGVTWDSLGAGHRLEGGWQVTNVSIPVRGVLRVQGQAAGSERGSEWFVETLIGDILITSHPSSRTNNAGTVATFTAAAVGPRPLSYRWLKDGTPLTDTSTLSGAATPSLQLSNVLKADEGGYALLVTNLSGSVTSLTATLTVKDPVIVTQPTNQLRDLGQEAWFSAAAQGTPPLGYQWWKDGAPLAGQTGAVLGVTSAQAADAGGYYLVASNAHGSVTSAVALLTVNAALLEAGFDPNVTDAKGTVLVLVPEPGGRTLVGGNFTGLGGQPRSMLARLNTDGSVQPDFNPAPNQPVTAILKQADGRIVVGGSFTSIGGQPRNRVARLHADGSLDAPFNPNANGVVYALAEQEDGRLVIAGAFSSLGGQPRSALARLEPEGALEAGFAPAITGGNPTTVRAVAMQPDGKLIVGGMFSAVGGVSRPALARLHPDGSLDAGFQPPAEGGQVGTSPIYALALQPDGKVVVARSAPRDGGSPLIRLNPDGTLDTAFSPTVTGTVYSVGLQVDGQIVVGGQIAALGGMARYNLGRLRGDGTVDATFVPQVNNLVYALALQGDGAVLLGGSFTSVTGQTRNRIARLANPTAAVARLRCDAFSFSWERQGSCPEVWRTTFQTSTDGTNWSLLGPGTRTTGGWTLAGVFAPVNSLVRARGFTLGSQYNGLGWFVEATMEVSPRTPPVILTSDGAFGLQTNAFGFTVRGLPGQAIVIEASADFVTWVPVQTNVVTGLAQFLFRDAQTGAHPQRFYRARLYEGLLPPPAIQTGPSSPAFQGAGFRFGWSAIAGQTVVIQTSTNLLNWEALETNEAGVGPAWFMDLAATNISARFYRLRLP